MFQQATNLLFISWIKRLGLTNRSKRFKWRDMFSVQSHHQRRVSLLWKKLPKMIDIFIRKLPISCCLPRISTIYSTPPEMKKWPFATPRTSRPSAQLVDSMLYSGCSHFVVFSQHSELSRPHLDFNSELLPVERMIEILLDWEKVHVQNRIETSIDHAWSAERYIEGPRPSWSHCPHHFASPSLNARHMAQPVRMGRRAGSRIPENVVKLNYQAKTSRKTPHSALHHPCIQTYSAGAPCV